MNNLEKKPQIIPIKKIDIVGKIIKIMKDKAPISHLEGGAMIFDLKDSKLIYYINARSLYHVFPNKENRELAKMKIINNQLELISCKSELELLQLLNDLEKETQNI